MSEWNDAELARIGRVGELRIAALREDGTAHAFLPIWVVQVGHEIYVRAYRGRSSVWFRQAVGSGQLLISAGGIEQSVTFDEAGDSVRASVDAAYRTKYGSGMYVDAMLAPAAVEATLRLTPARPAGD